MLLPANTHILLAHNMSLIVGDISTNITTSAEIWQCCVVKTLELCVPSEHEPLGEYNVLAV